jgi:hypothetical protein
MPTERKIQRALWILLLISFALRSFIAAFIELGNDEVYYWTYAKFPDWSHFDHPPMVGWVIQFFTLNLRFDSEFFLRLGSIVFGTVNTFLIYLIGKKIKDPLTGFYASLLFTASFYCFIIAGTFIMPDTPQVLFWLLSLYLLLKALPDKNLTSLSRRTMILAGVTIGLAMLSKYHSVFLILGASLYILFFNRRWLKAKETYFAFLIAVILFTPVIIWNYQNQFISFTFHESRVNTSGFSLRWDYFLTELAGQFGYNNPVNFILILFSFVALVRGKKFIEKKQLWVILLMSLPLSLVFLSFSLFSSTLPHWTGPAYLGFMIIAAAYLRDRAEQNSPARLVPVSVRVALLLLFLIIVGGFTQINYGWIPFKKWKSDDFSVQLYGWRQLGEKFPPIAEKHATDNTMPADAPIITFRWFPAANLDYYVASPSGNKVYALGTLTRIHKYYWIDKERGNLPIGISVYYIAFSDDYQYPGDLFGHFFDSIDVADTIPIYRGHDLIRKAYVYRLYGLKREIRFNNLTDFTEPTLERIRYWENQIRIHPEWMRQMAEKAKAQNRTIEDLIWQEAKWTAEREMME